MAITRLSSFSLNVKDKKSSLSAKYRHINDLFDRQPIYDTFQILRKKFHGDRNFHCFYFGLNDLPSKPMKFTYKNIQNRNLLLEEILNTAIIVFDLTGITLTSVSLRKNSLITKEATKSLYLDPNNTNLWPMNFTGIKWADQMAELIGFELRRLETYSSNYVLHSSLNDDLEDLLESVRNNDLIEGTSNTKHIFFINLLTHNQMKQLQFQDEEYINTFHASNYNIPTEMIMKSNSKSKFEFWTGFRTSMNIPSADNPYMDEGGFNLLPFGNYWTDPYMNFVSIEFSKKCESFELVWTINFDRFLNLKLLMESVEPEIYCRNFHSPQIFSLIKKAGQMNVFFDEEYLNLYYFVDFEDPANQMIMYMPHIEKIYN